MSKIVIATVLASMLVGCAGAGEYAGVAAYLLQGRSARQDARTMRHMNHGMRQSYRSGTLRITPDVFGPGIGKDQYGRPVYQYPRY